VIQARQQARGAMLIRLGLRRILADGVDGVQLPVLGRLEFTAPRRVYGLIVAFNLTRGPGIAPGGDAEPRCRGFA
jgi:hypothetical protein